MSGLIREALVIEHLKAPINSRIDPSNGAERLLVELHPASSCQRCARGEGCGAGLLASASQPVQLVVHDRLGAKVGQWVQIEGSSDPNWLRVVASAYGLPTLGLLSGAILPRMIGVEAEWVAVSGAAIGLCCSILLWQRVIEPNLQAASGACRFDVIETAHTVSIDPAEVS